MLVFDFLVIFVIFGLFRVLLIIIFCNIFLFFVLFFNKVLFVFFIVGFIFIICLVYEDGIFSFVILEFLEFFLCVVFGTKNLGCDLGLKGFGDENILIIFVFFFNLGFV